MAEKKTPGPVTTGSLAHPAPLPEPEFPHEPPRRLEAPAPGVAIPKAVPVPAGAIDWRVLIRHSPTVARYKSLVVKALDEAGAWAQYQVDLAAKLTEEGEPGKRLLGAFLQWLAQQPPHRIPPDVSITTETEYQGLRKAVREAKPQPVR